MATTNISPAEVPVIHARLRAWIQAVRECEAEVARLRAAGVATGGILADLVPLTEGLALGLELLDDNLQDAGAWPRAAQNGPLEVA